MQTRGSFLVIEKTGEGYKKIFHARSQVDQDISIPNRNTINISLRTKNPWIRQAPLKPVIYPDAYRVLFDAWPKYEHAESRAVSKYLSLYE